MRNYNELYELTVLNEEGALVSAYIYDTTSGTGGTQTITPLTGWGDTPIERTIIDNDEDVFKEIRATQVTMNFVSTTTENITTFSIGEANKWLVDLYYDGQLVFVGYLEPEEMIEDFQDASIGLQVTLTATDGLGLLKDIPLTKPDGTNPRGYFKIVEYVAWALQKTGLELPIRVLNNIGVGDLPGVTMYRACYMHSKSFEDEINISEDCYTVLEKILKRNCFLTQRNGEWWIIRPDEYHASSFTVHNFDADGLFVDTSVVTNDSFIGFNEAMRFSNEQTTVAIDSPYKSIELEYNYRFPLEIIDNIDFGRGDERPLLEQTIPGATKYTLDDWTLKREYPGGGSSGSVGAASTYIVRKFDANLYEIERYAVLTPGSTSAFPAVHIESNGVPVGEKDKFTFSVDFRLASNISGTGAVIFPIAVIYLVMTGGAIRILNEDGTWSAGFTSLSARWQREALDESEEWQTLSIEADPIEAEGEIFVQLLHANMIPANGYNGDIHYSNLTFVYQPYINGSYHRYRGHRNKVEQTAESRKKLDDEVFIGDSPRPLFKGGLFLRAVLGGIELDIWRLLGAEYYAANDLPSGADPNDWVHFYGHMQAFDVWNQHNRYFRRFEVTVQGIGDLPGDPTNRWLITDASDHTDNKTFILLHHSQDLNMCEWTGVMREVNDSTIPKRYTDVDDHSFRYIYDREGEL
jgi:hypothetical protein